MSNIFETINYKGYEINIYQDEYFESPRAWGQSSEIVGTCKDYKVYDVKNPYAGDTGNYLDDFRLYLSDKCLKLDDVIYLPVSVCIHSGIALSIGCSHGWDSGQVGYIYEIKKEVRKEYSTQRISKKLLNHIENRLINEISIFNDYCNGNVYGYEITKNGESIDILGGFYGYNNKNSDLLIEAQGFIDNKIEQNRLKKQEKTKTMIKYHVPLLAR